ncbi:Metalloprotease [Mycena polygramma]|nr:Metalloprotease [Mycena polygramma]
MFFSPLAVLFFATAALAAPSNQGALTIVLSASHNLVDSIADILLTAAVTNSGTKDITVIKYGTILDAAQGTRSFTVTRDGTPILFTGVTLSLSLPDLDDKDCVTIPAGQTVTVVHNVSSLFDFAAVGPGTFSFAPVTTFQAAPPAHEISTDTQVDAITATANTISVTITRDVAPRALPSRYTNGCTDPTKRDKIDFSINQAWVLSYAAKRYINERGTSDPLYMSYFGANDPARILSVFAVVENAAYSRTTLTLQCDAGSPSCSGSLVAWSHPAIPYYNLPATINYCDRFFNLPSTRGLCNTTASYDTYGSTVGGTSLHEMTHSLNDGIYDYYGTYGCARCLQLPDTEKINNAENYNCFAAEAYMRNQC